MTLCLNYTISLFVITLFTLCSQLHSLLIYDYTRCFELHNLIICDYTIVFGFQFQLHNYTIRALFLVTRSQYLLFPNWHSVLSYIVSLMWLHYSRSIFSYTISLFVITPFRLYFQLHNLIIFDFIIHALFSVTQSHYL